MSDHSVALPRIRVRRRRPNPKTICEFLWALGALVVIGKTLFIYFTTGHLNELRLGIFVAFFVFQRRRFLTIKNMEDHDRLPLPVPKWDWALLALLWSGIVAPPW